MARASRSVTRHLRAGTVTGGVGGRTAARSSSITQVARRGSISAKRGASTAWIRAHAGPPLRRRRDERHDRRARRSPPGSPATAVPYRAIARGSARGTGARIHPDARRSAPALPRRRATGVSPASGGSRRGRAQPPSARAPLASMTIGMTLAARRESQTREADAGRARGTGARPRPRRRATRGTGARPRPPAAPGLPPSAFIHARRAVHSAVSPPPRSPPASLPATRGPFRPPRPPRPPGHPEGPRRPASTFALPHPHPTARDLDPPR